MKIGQTFKQDGIWWRVSATGPGFAIATRCSVEGEPESNSDILKVVS